MEAWRRIITFIKAPTSRENSSAMDPRYPSHDDRRYRPSSSRNYEDEPEEYWRQEHQFEDPEHSSQAIDPELEYHSPTSPTILPPGTSVSGYSRYSQTGQSNYASSAQRQQIYDPPSSGGEAYDYSVYTYGTGQDAASSYQYDYGVDEVRNPDQVRHTCGPDALLRFVANAVLEGNGFTTLNDLERHGRSKHGDDGQYIECRHPYCPDIGKRFPRRDNFIDHFWRVHGNTRTKEEIKPYALEMAKKWMVVKEAGSWSGA
ncbi:hypothetical protein Dda_6756 [Drechslerella dactyloides]|uniref:Uncharacterized protein n=1 Tax=Drechslerella dactyloides TaxID=74499 RepID=A0AAD6IY19_DREDA|nr:hypothetical protein Dda_6756 [Drechslerella dactyloides]